MEKHRKLKKDVEANLKILWMLFNLNLATEYQLVNLNIDRWRLEGML